MFIEVPNETAQLINLIFENIMGCFPSFYSLIKNQSDLNKMKKIWFKSFVDYDLLDKNYEPHEDKIYRAIYAIRGLNQPFPPSCGQFIALALE